jgi:hypothetical protein
LERLLEFLELVGRHGVRREGFDGEGGEVDDLGLGFLARIELAQIPCKLG